MEDRKHTDTFPVAPVLPDGSGGYAPCPELLTDDEAVRYLRLDEDGSSDPKRTLKYYRDTARLIAIKVGKKNRYRRRDLENFLAQKSEEKQGRLAFGANRQRGVSN